MKICKDVLVMFGHFIKRQVANALERVCFDGAQSVSWARWTDPVRVQDAVLKPDVLSKLFNLSLEISGGYVGSLLVDSSTDGCLVVTIDRLLLVAVKKAETLSQGGFTASLLKPLKKIFKKILPLAKIRVTNFHFRLEDVDRRAVIGLVSRAVDCTEIFGNFRSVGIYFQANETEMISTTDLSSRTHRFRQLMNARKNFFKYIVSPFSGNFRINGDLLLAEIADVVNVNLPPDQVQILADIWPQKRGHATFSFGRFVVVEKLRVSVTSANGVQKLLTMDGISGERGLVEISEIDISGFLVIRGLRLDFARKLAKIASVEIDRKKIQTSDELKPAEEAYSPRSLGGYDSDWASVADSVFYEARSPRVSFARTPLTMPQTDWRGTVGTVRDAHVGELRGVEISSDELAIAAFKAKDKATQEVGIRFNLKEKRMHADKYPAISVQATEVSASTASVGFSLFARLSDDVSVELEEVTINKTGVSVVRGEMKIMPDVSVVLSSILFDISTGTCDQASLTLVESDNIHLMRLSLSDIRAQYNKLSVRQVNLRNLFASSRSDPSYIALKDVSASFSGAMSIEAVMAHVGSDMPALVRKLSGLFVPPSTEKYTVENGLWTAVELIALTSGEEKFISRIASHSSHVLEFPRKFRIVLVKDFAGRLIGTLARGKREFNTFYFCRPVFGRLRPGAITLKVEFEATPLPGANFLHKLDCARNVRLDVASMRVVLAPSEHISVHAEIDGFSFAELGTLRNSAASKLSLEKFIVVDRGNPADPLLELGHTEVWKEVDRVFISVPKAQVHADLEIADHLNTIKSVFQSSFTTLRVFSKPAIPGLVVVNAFELELYAKRLFKVLALDKVPLQLAQCVLREPAQLGRLGEWYADEISGQWLQVALHIDVYGQPMALVRNITSRIKSMCRSFLSIATFGHI